MSIIYYILGIVLVFLISDSIFNSPNYKLKRKANKVKRSIEKTTENIKIRYKNLNL